MRKFSLLLCFFLLNNPLLQAQQPKANVDSIETLLNNSATNGYEWAYCGSINKLLKDDTVTVYAYSKKILFFPGCPNDTLSIFDFAKERTLISERSKNNRRASISFNTRNTFITSFRKTKSTIIITFKSYPDVYRYRLLLDEQTNSTSTERFVLTLIKI